MENMKQSLSQNNVFVDTPSHSGESKAEINPDIDNILAGIKKDDESRGSEVSETRSSRRSRRSRRKLRVKTD